MASEELVGLRRISVQASADLSTKQFYFMTINSSSQLATTTVAGGTTVDGILADKPAAAGRAGQLTLTGCIERITCGGTFAAGDNITSDANGKAVKAATGDTILGKAMVAGASGSIVSILFDRRGTGP